MKTLPLILMTVFLTIASHAQTDSSFVNGAGNCSLTNSGRTYYCTGMQTFASDGTYTGYVGLYFTVNTDGTFNNGHVYKTDVGGNSVFTANNFAGTKVGTTVSGTFSGGNFSGSIDSETLGTKQGRCYKGRCGTVWYIHSGSGWYQLN